MQSPNSNEMERASVRKRAYNPPRLTVYGSVQKVTTRAGTKVDAPKPHNN